MRTLIKPLVLILATLPGWAVADTVRVKSGTEVGATMDALEAAVTGAGATVFARVDHAAGAASVDMQLAPAELLIFGNPMLGTPAMQDAIEAGLHLPLKVLVYEDAEGQTWLAYDDPAAALAALEGVAPDAPYLAKMQGALAKLTSAAAAN